MILRPSRLASIARRDLALETRGRGGWVLHAVTTVLLLPCATLPAERPTPPPIDWTVSGDVPETVAALDGVRVVPEGVGSRIHFEKRGDQLMLEGGMVPPLIRDALDGAAPEIRREDVRPDLVFPRRSLVLAMLSASLITGAVSGSIAGERSRRTLETLLAAAVTRAEVVIGKWLAWAGYGALTGLVAATVAMALGRIEPGWWLLPFPLVAGGTVALGLYLVRRTGDVVSSATTSMRILPAVLGGSGLFAWFLSSDGAWTGAFVPLGGALLAAGALWEEPQPSLIAFGVTGAMTALLLARTVRDLEKPATVSTSVVARLWRAAVVSLVAGLAWCACVAGPVMWAKAGNPAVTADLGTDSGVLAGAFSLALLVLALAGREAEPARAAGLTAPSTGAWFVAMPVALAVAVATTTRIASPPDGLYAAQAAARLADAASLGGFGLAAIVVGILAQETLFRGILQRSVGPGPATLLFALALTPHDLAQGVAVGAPLAALTAATGSIVPAVAARAAAVPIAHLGVADIDPIAVLAASAVATLLATTSGAWARALVRRP